MASSISLSQRVDGAELNPHHRTWMAWASNMQPSVIKTKWNYFFDMMNIRCSTCKRASGGKSMELRVSTDSILRCLDCRWNSDMESVLASEGSSSCINEPPSSSLPSSELEPPSPDRRDWRSPHWCFWRLSDGARPKLDQLDRRLFLLLPELRGPWGEVLWAAVWDSQTDKKNITSSSLHSISLGFEVLGTTEVFVSHKDTCHLSMLSVNASPLTEDLT